MTPKKRVRVYMVECRACGYSREMKGKDAANRRRIAHSETPAHARKTVEVWEGWAD